MGQYYVIANMDKREYFSPWDLACGCKLMEFSWQGSKTNLVLSNLLMNHWFGDRVYVIGDYADYRKHAKEKDQNWQKTYNGLAKECGFLGKLADEDNKFLVKGYPYTLYVYVQENFKNIGVNLTDSDCQNLSNPVYYLVNRQTKEYINLTELPYSWTKDGKPDFNPYTGKKYFHIVSPLTLLLAMGNGRGGGDYFAEDDSLAEVGYWVSSSQHIRLVQSLYEEYEQYEKFTPDFKE